MENEEIVEVQDEVNKDTMEDLLDGAELVEMEGE